VAQASDAERDRCHERIGRAAADSDLKVDLDPNGRFARDAEPYLTRQPVNGCKPVIESDADQAVTGARGPLDSSGPKAAFRCRWLF
jgi:hypothetical protein